MFMCIGITALVAIVQPVFSGQIYSKAEALDLLEGLQNASLYFGSATATASATILALMLTLLSMTSQVDTQFDRSTYSGIRLIGLISTMTFVGSMLLLLSLSFPVGEFEKVPTQWFRALYYILSALNGFLAGLMIVGVLVLFETISLLINKIAPERD